VRKIIFIMTMLVLFARNGLTAEITIEELTQNIEKALDQIQDITFTSTLKLRQKDSDDAKTLTKGTVWYKKSGLGKQELTMSYSPEQKHIVIYKVEGDSFYTYEILSKEDKIMQMKYPLKLWESAEINPGFFYKAMKKLIQSGAPYSIEYQKDLNMYEVRFVSEKESFEFQIKGDSWIPFGMIQKNEKGIVERVRENFVINAGIPDELFNIPLGSKTQTEKRVLADEISAIEITRCGIIKNVTEKEYFEPEKLLNPKNMIVTNHAKVEKGAIFGCVYTVKGKPSGADVSGLLKVIIAHPKITNPRTGKSETETQMLTLDVFIDKEDPAMMIFWSSDDDAYKRVPGEWAFQFWADGKKLNEKTFIVE
jgi:outer membrane lipoprotein-sorting protein